MFGFYRTLISHLGIIRLSISWPPASSGLEITSSVDAVIRVSRSRRFGLALAPLMILGMLAGGFTTSAQGQPGSPGAPLTPPAAPEVVSVMLELDAEPAVTAYMSARNTRAAGIATRVAVAEVQAVATSVRAALQSEMFLFETTNVYAGVAVLANVDNLDVLAQIPGVRAVHRLVPKERTNFISVPLIGAPAAWIGGAGTGEGITIGIMDTGIDFTHADFGGPGTPAAYQAAFAAQAAGASPVYPDPAKVAGGYDFAGYAYNASDPASAVPQPNDNPLDCQGHGTHVAGSAGGYGVAADGSTYRGPWNNSTPFDTMGIGPGVAPEATLYAIKVFGCGPSTTTDLIVKGLDWALDPNGDGDFADRLDVVNMSLGSAFGSPEDPDSVATNRISEAGVMVVASAGNSGDYYEITVSPGIARRALSVAASEDNGQIVSGFRANIGGSPASYPALLGEAYDWISKQGARGSVNEIGNWSEPPSSGNNSDGCEPFSPIDAARVAGTIVFLQWEVNDSLRRCGSAARVNNAAAAGAIGAILAGTQTLFSVGIAGNAVIPSVLTLGSTTTALHDALQAGTPVTATLDNSLRNSERVIVTGPQDPTDTAMGFTSRGSALAGNVKPDISAPGGSIFSAAVGTGSGGVSFSGTSMAAPLTAGAAALVLAANPDWTTEQVKAALMNTADHDLYLLPGRTGPKYDNLRMGSGRLDARRAVETEAVAFSADDPGAISVSFGVMNVVSPTSKSKTIRIQDLRSSGGARSYSVGLQAVHSLPGATYSVSSSSLSLRPGQSREIAVTLTVDPRRLTHRADPTITLFPLGDGVMRDFLTDVSSLVKVTPAGGSTLRVPVFAAPRPASTLTAPSTVRVRGTGVARGSFTLSGRAVDVKGTQPYERERSRITALQLMADSPRLPQCEPGTLTDCVTTNDQASADIRYVGFTSDAPVIAARGDDPLSPTTPAKAYIGISSWKPWRTAANIATFMVYLDTNNDGTADLVVMNDNAGEDIFVAAAFSMRSADDSALISDEFINNVAGNKDTAKMHSNVMTLPINLASLANPTDAQGNPLEPFIQQGQSTISYWVEGWGVADEVLTPIDVIGGSSAPLRSDLLSPALTAFPAAGNVPAIATSGTRLSVRMNSARAGANPRLLLLHHLNTLNRKAQVVSITR